MLHGYGASDVGLVRGNNEDAYLISEAGEGLLLALVADGLGGHNGGEVASALAVSELKRAADGELRTAKEPDTRAKSLAKIAQRTHSRIVEQGRADASCYGMGTTLTAVLADATCGTLVQVGDSRCYLWQGGALQALSVDQTKARQLLDAGIISEEEYLSHPRRNELSQCLGGQYDWLPIDPVLTDFEWARGDKLLLCSDGLTDMVADANIGQLLGVSPPSDAPKALVELALDAGGFDNVTVVVVENGG